ncbi:hypothetical protein GGP41_008594 [Bipolaris sorokiniana]|uniref:Uncharacterized protein n=1 Tax=Cochliobolus sativus TaxID=45130 RepID=A0A8H5Z9F1_COCSA|nr:hypothetical protein GGP41_008594 [Bipolaris sorokiniana]
MSNSVVGGVYQQIMEKVIQASQNDFEESGVDQSTLEEMKQVCCNLASILAVAPFLASVAAWQPSRLWLAREIVGAQDCPSAMGPRPRACPPAAYGAL